MKSISVFVFRKNKTWAKRAVRDYDENHVWLARRDLVAPAVYTSVEPNHCLVIVTYRAKRNDEWPKKIATERQVRVNALNSAGVFPPPPTMCRRPTTTNYTTRGLVYTYILYIYINETILLWTCDIVYEYKNVTNVSRNKAYKHNTYIHAYICIYIYMIRKVIQYSYTSYGIYNCKLHASCLYNIMCKKKNFFEEEVFIFMDPSSLDTPPWLCIVLLLLLLCLHILFFCVHSVRFQNFLE